MSAEIPNLTSEEIAAYVADMASRLKQVCELNEWWSIAANLKMVLDEASRLAKGDSKPPEQH